MSKFLLPKTKQPEREDVVIAVIGDCGSGKSSFINQFLKNTKAFVGHKLSPATTNINEYQIKLGEEKVILIDTPGLDLVEGREDSVFSSLGTWMSTKYGRQKPLDGVVFLQSVASPVTNKTLRGSTLVNVLEGLLGKDPHPGRIVLATTMWHDFVNDEKSTAVANELKNDHWKLLELRGSAVEDYDNTSESAERYIWKILAAQTRIKHFPLQDHLIIAVIGPSQASKCTFIESLIKEKIPITNTRSITPYSIKLKEEKVLLLHTPNITFGSVGADSPKHIFNLISQWLNFHSRVTRRSSLTLDGIIILHPMHSSFDENVLMKPFHKLLGGQRQPSNDTNRVIYRRVVLSGCATLETEDTELEPEGEEEHWTILKAAGASVKDFDGSNSSARSIIDVIVEDRKVGDSIYQYRNIMKTLSDLNNKMQSQHEQVVEQIRLVEAKYDTLLNLHKPNTELSDDVVEKNGHGVILLS